MPFQYDIEMPDGYTYTLETLQEVSDNEAIKLLQQQLGSSPQQEEQGLSLAEQAAQELQAEGKWIENVRRAEEASKPGILSTITPNPIEVGILQGRQAIDAAMHRLGMMNDEDFAAKVSETARKINEIPYGDRTMAQIKEFQEEAEKGYGPAFVSAITNPLALGTFAGESIGAMGYGAAATAGTVWGMGKFQIPNWIRLFVSANMLGATEGINEATGSLIESVAEYTDYNIEDPEQVQKALMDEDFLKQARIDAKKRGVPIYAWSALTAGLAHIPYKLATKSGITRKSVALGAAGGLGIGAIGGVGGEVNAQLNEKGYVYDKGAVVLEGLLEGVMGGPQAVYNTMFIDGMENPFSAIYKQSLDKWRGEAKGVVAGPALGKNYAIGTQGELFGVEQEGKVVPQTKFGKVPANIRRRIAEQRTLEEIDNKVNSELESINSQLEAARKKPDSVSPEKINELTERYNDLKGYKDRFQLDLGFIEEERVAAEQEGLTETVDELETTDEFENLGTKVLPTKKLDSTQRSMFSERLGIALDKITSLTGKNRFFNYKNLSEILPSKRKRLGEQKGEEQLTMDLQEGPDYNVYFPTNLNKLNNKLKGFNDTQVTKHSPGKINVTAHPESFSEGNTVNLVLDSRNLQGVLPINNKNKNKAGSDYSVLLSGPKSVKGLVVKNKKIIDNLKKRKENKNTAPEVKEILDDLDFDNVRKIEDGYYIERRTKAPEPESTAAEPEPDPEGLEEYYGGLERPEEAAEEALPEDIDPANGLTQEEISNLQQLWAAHDQETDVAKQQKLREKAEKEERKLEKELDKRGFVLNKEDKTQSEIDSLIRKEIKDNRVKDPRQPGFGWHRMATTGSTIDETILELLEAVDDAFGTPYEDQARDELFNYIKEYYADDPKTLDLIDTVKEMTRDVPILLASGDRPNEVFFDFFLNIADQKHMIGQAGYLAPENARLVFGKDHNFPFGQIAIKGPEWGQKLKEALVNAILSAAEEGDIDASQIGPELKKALDQVTVYTDVQITPETIFHELLHSAVAYQNSLIEDLVTADIESVFETAVEKFNKIFEKYKEAFNIIKQNDSELSELLFDISIQKQAGNTPAQLDALQRAGQYIDINYDLLSSEDIKTFNNTVKNANKKGDIIVDFTHIAPIFQEDLKTLQTLFKDKIMDYFKVKEKYQNGETVTDPKLKQNYEQLAPVDFMISYYFEYAFNEQVGKKGLKVRNTNIFDNPEEILTWAITNDRMREITKRMVVEEKVNILTREKKPENLWEALKQFLAKLFKRQPALETYTEKELVSLFDKVLETGQSYIELDLEEMKTGKVDKLLKSIDTKGEVDLQLSNEALDLAGFLPERTYKDFVKMARNEGLPFSGHIPIKEAYEKALTNLLQQKEIERNPYDSNLTKQAQDLAASDYASALEKVKELPDLFQSKYGEKIKGTELTPQALEEFKPVIKKIKQIVRRVGGDAANLKLIDQAFYMSNAQSVPEAIEGARFWNTILVALSGENPTENVYHELWHFLERFGVITKQDIKRINRELPKWQKYFEKQGLLDPVMGWIFTVNPSAQAEMRATIFGKIAYEWDTTGKISKPLFESESNSILAKAYKALKEILSSVLGLKSIRTSADIFEDAFNGELAVQDLIQLDNTLDLQRTSAALKSSHQQMLYNPEELDMFSWSDVKESTKRKKEFQDARFNEVGPVNPLAAKFYTKFGLSRENPFMEEAFKTAESLREMTARYMQRFQKLSDPYWKLPKAARYAIAEITLENSINGVKATQPGGPGTPLFFARNNKTIRIDNPIVADGYMAMQQMFAEALMEEVKVYKEGFLRQFPSLTKAFLTESLQDSIKRIAKLEKEQRDATKRKQLNNFKASLKIIANTLKSDYFPEMRFGDYYIAVYKKPPIDSEKEKGDIVAFYKIERNPSFPKSKKGNKRFHPDQHKQVVEQIRSKYSDTSKFVVWTDQTGVQTDMHNLQFAKSTRDFETNIINPDTISIEMLASIMDEKYVDPVKLSQAQNSLIGQTLLKGFNKKFASARHLDGYSKDYDRVMGAYVHGLSFSLSNMRHAPKFTALKDSALGLQDEVLKELLLGPPNEPHKGYLEYITNPVEDWQEFRILNFLWALGGNLSSALLQYATVPTVTYSNMNMYSANFLNNAFLLTKWFGIAHSFVPKNVTMRTGAHIDFSNEKMWSKLRKTALRNLNDDQFNQIKEIATYEYQTGNLGAPFTEESLGPSEGGTQTFTEKLKRSGHKALQYSGFFIGIAEQLTRFNSLMATAELMVTNPNAQARAERIYVGRSDGEYAATAARRPGASLSHNVAAHTVFRAHAIFGKTARPEIFKGALGAGVFPFMTWPHHQFGRLGEQAFKMGPEGAVGFVTTLGAMFLMGGMMGMPGAELIKELYEAFAKKLGPREIDVINEIHNHYYDDRYKAEFITHGSSRAGLGLDVASRFGWGIPGQDLILSAIGSKKDPTAILGVPGTIFSGAFRAFNSYNTDAGAAAIAQDMLPVALANVVKAIDYQQNGLKNRDRTITLLPPEQLTAGDIWWRAMGVSTAHLSRAREKHFFSKVIARSHQPKYTKLKKKMENHMERAVRALQNNQETNYAKHMQDYYEAEQDLIDWALESNYYPPVLELNRNILETTSQRMTGDIRMDRIPDQNRHLIYDLMDRDAKWQAERD